MDSTTEVAVLTENTSLDVMTVSVLLTVIMDEIVLIVSVLLAVIMYEVSHCITEENKIETTL